MNDPKISIIIPLYNIEKYIINCLNSIKVQTYVDYEVIIVNDGSKDNSLQTVQEYIQENALSNWHLIDKENGGPSSARNAGLSIAKGEYIVFIDGDDWVEDRCLELMYNAMKKSDSDFLFSSYRIYDECADEFETWGGYEDDAGCLPQELYRVYSLGYIWAHMYKKAILDEYNIRFNESIYCGEDTAFNLEYITKVNKFCAVGDIVYNYRINRSDAITRKLIHPSAKKHLYDCMMGLKNCFDEADIIYALEKNNVGLLRLMWDELYTSVTNNILDGESKRARRRLKEKISKTILNHYIPRSKKEKIMKFCLKHSFLALSVLVKVYYNNYESLRKTKFIRSFSGKRNRNMKPSN